MQLFYIGGYGGDPYGLKLCEYDPINEKISVIKGYKIEDASYICLSKDKKKLYSVIEKNEYKGREGGGVAAYSIAKDGRLVFLNDSFTVGAGPCYLSVNKAGDMLCTANYGGGSLSLFSIEANGRIGSYFKLIDNKMLGTASNADEERQKQPHAHYIAQKELYGTETLWMCDLGMDLVVVLDRNGVEICRLKTRPGAGPRHIAFHIRKSFAYLACELSNEIYCFSYEKSSTGLSVSLSSIVSALPSPNRKSSCAAIRISPGGGYLLVSNRGEKSDCISVFKIDEKSGLPQLIHTKPTYGRCPRDFSFSVSEDRIFCANQESDVVTVFKWDEKNGDISSPISELKTFKPTSIVFL